MASIGKEVDQIIHSGQSVSKSLGYLPPVESNLPEVPSTLPSTRTEALTAKVPLRADTAWRCSQEIGFFPSHEDSEKITLPDMPYSRVNVVEEARKAMEQVGAQNKVL